MAPRQILSEGGTLGIHLEAIWCVKYVLAHLLSEVYSEIFRNQIYFSFFQNIWIQEEKSEKFGENTIMMGAL